MKNPADPNPGRAERDWPPVVVAGAYFTGLLLMRNLVRRGLTACCFDCHPEFPGFRTVYGPAHECPNPDDRPDAWLAFMIGLARTFDRKPVLISSADQFVTAMAAHGRSLEDHFVFNRPAVELQAVLATKERQYSLAAEHGMPVPRTRFVRNVEEVRAFAAGATFPCLLKPVHFRLWEPLPEGHPLRFQKLVTADAPEALIAAYQLAAGVDPGVVVQEIIQGADTAKVVYLSCYGRGGEAVASCVVREVRTDPIFYGSASVVEPVDDPEVESICESFLRKIGYSGLCEIELKRDSRDGRLMMIEANPRYSVTADAAPYAGVDLGWLHYLDLIGRPVARVKASGRNFRHIVLQRDFAAIGSYRRAGLETWASILRSYRPPVAFFDFDPRDYRVTAWTLAVLARNMLPPSARKFLSRRRPAGPVEPA